MPIEERLKELKLSDVMLSEILMLTRQVYSVKPYNNKTMNALKRRGLVEFHLTVTWKDLQFGEWRFSLEGKQFADDYIKSLRKGDD